VSSAIDTARAPGQVGGPSQPPGPAGARTFLVATFSDPDRLIHAVSVVRGEKLRVHDVYAPYPIHGLDAAMGIRRTRLPWVTLLAGLFGLTFALTMQFYANVLDWRINVGGKPDNSTLAFIPITFELTVLLGALSTVAALLVRARLYPGKQSVLAAEGVTDHVFALVLRQPETPFARRRIDKILLDCGATEITDKEASL
jgi:hypothetical protein